MPWDYPPGEGPAGLAPPQPKLPWLSVNDWPLQPLGSESVTIPPAASGAPFDVRVPVRFTVPPRGPDAAATTIVEGFIVPMPVNVTDWLPDGALSRMVMPPLWLPEGLGVKVTWMVQLAPGAIRLFGGQPFDWLKLPYPVLWTK